MKKALISLLSVAALATALVGCGEQKQPEVKETKTLDVQFVPSKNADSIMLVATELEGLLKDYLAKNYDGEYNYEFKISVGTDFEAVMEGLTSGQVAIGFLTSQQYAQASLEQPGTVEVLLTSVRHAMEVQLLDLDEQVAWMNGNPNYHGEYVAKNTDDVDYQNAANSGVPGATNQYVIDANASTIYVDGYAAMMLTTKELYEAGYDSIEDFAGKKVCALKMSSGSGYVRPAILLGNNNMKFVTGTADASKGEVEYILKSGHTDSIKGLLAGDCDAAFGYHDVRRDLYWASASNTADDTDGDGVVEEYKNIFETTRIVALSDIIYNDTISASTDLPQDLRKAIADAFYNIIQTPDGAKALGAYTHVGYLYATDEAYEGERVAYTTLQKILASQK